MTVSKQGVFFGVWANVDDMWASFQGKYTHKGKVPPSEAGVEVLWASYDYMSYSGYAWVIFTKQGKLYEVNSSHCSCYGLQGTWSPEETSWEFIEATYLRNIDNGLTQKHTPEALAVLYTLLQRKTTKKKEPAVKEVSKSMQKRVAIQSDGEVTIISQGELRTLRDALNAMSLAFDEGSLVSRMNELQERLRGAKTIKVVE